MFFIRKIGKKFSSKSYLVHEVELEENFLREKFNFMFLLISAYHYSLQHEQKR